MIKVAAEHLEMMVSSNLDDGITPISDSVISRPQPWCHSNSMEWYYHSNMWCYRLNLGRWHLSRRIPPSLSLSPAAAGSRTHHQRAGGGGEEVPTLQRNRLFRGGKRLRRRRPTEVAEVVRPSVRPPSPPPPPPRKKKSKERECECKCEY